MCFLDWLQKAHCIVGCLKNIDFSQVLLKGTFLPKCTLILEFETFVDGMHSSGATPSNKRTIQSYTCCLLSSFKTYNITFDDMDLLNPSRAIPQKIGCRGGNPGYVIPKVGLRVRLGFRYGRSTRKQLRLVSKEILKGLDHMHRNGIFHRDVKPENLLLLDDEARWCLLYLVSPGDTSKHDVKFS